MIVIQVLLCFCYMCVIPYLIGCLFVDGQKDVGNVTILRTVAGLMISYAVYEILEVGFQLKNGSFSLAVTAIVLAIIVVVNLIIGQLPSKLLNWDLSETGIFSVSDTSKELLKDLDKDVTVEVVAETGNIDSRIEKFISIYGDLSSKLKVSYIDPVLHPEILTKYGISANSVVVSCEETGKNQVISFSDIIVSQQNYYGYSSE